MKKGFIGIALLIGLAIISVASAWYANYQLSQKSLGTAVQTQLTDTLGTFRTNVNSSLVTLDANIATITSTQATYGNLVTINSPLPVANGGTGTSTAPSNLQFLVGNSAIPTWLQLGSSTGISLTQTATSVIIGTAGFDNTANILFTGNNTSTGQWVFQSSTKFTSTATTTFSSPTSFTASSTFSGFPQIPSSTPTQVTDAASKNFVDANRPILLTTTSTDAIGTSRVANSGGYTAIASSSFTLANPGHIMMNTYGTAYNDTISDGCKFTFYIDGNDIDPVLGQGNGISQFAALANNTKNGINFAVITTSTLAVGAHTANFEMATVTGGICNAMFIYNVEFLGN